MWSLQKKWTAGFSIRYPRHKSARTINSSSIFFEKMHQACFNEKNSPVSLDLLLGLFAPLRRPWLRLSFRSGNPGIGIFHEMCIKIKHACTCIYTCIYYIVEPQLVRSLGVLFEGHHKGLRLCCTDFTYYIAYIYCWKKTSEHTLCDPVSFCRTAVTDSGFTSCRAISSLRLCAKPSSACRIKPQSCSWLSNCSNCALTDAACPWAAAALRIPCESIAKRRIAGHLLASARIPYPSHVVFEVPSALASALPSVFDLQSHLSAGHLSDPAHFCLLCFLAVQAAAAGW